MGAAMVGALLAVALLATTDVSKLQRNAPVALLMVVASYLLFVAISYESGWIQHYPFLIGTQAPMILLPGPLLYLYVSGATEKTPKLHWAQLLHFLPFVIYLIWLMPILSAPGDYKLQVLEQSYFADSPRFQTVQIKHMSLGLLHLAIYWVLGYRKVRIAEVSQRVSLIFVMASVALIGLTFFARLLIDAFTSLSTHQTALPAFSLIALFLLALCLGAVRNAQAWLVPESQQAKYQKSGIDTAQAKAIAADVMEKIKSQELYTMPDLSLQQVADVTGYSRHQISQAFNAGLDRKFSAIVNALRLDHAREMLEQGRVHSVSDIAHASGFSSRSTFYTVFKENLGMSPGEYRKNLSNPTR